MGLSKYGRLEDRELQKVTMNLFRGDFERLQNLYPRSGAAKVVRLLVQSHIQTIDTKTGPRPATMDLEIAELLRKGD